MNKKLEDMTLEELLDFDQKNKVFSSREYIFNQTELKSNILTGGFYASIEFFLFNQLLIFPNIITPLFMTFFLYKFSEPLKMVLSIQKDFDLKKLLTQEYEEYRNNSPLRKELDRLYNNFLQDYVKAYQESTLPQDTVSFLLYANLLLKAGFFSVTNQFHTPDIYEVYAADSIYVTAAVDYLSYYVMAGYGCCRHVNSFFADLLRVKGLIADKIGCMECEEKQLPKREKNYQPNHLIVGYIENDAYHLVDPFNNIFCIQKKEEFYHHKNHIYIPDFSDHFFNIPHYELGMKYEEVKENDRYHLLQKLMEYPMPKELQKVFTNHKKMIEKIAYLTPIEFERQKEKEKRKII